MAVPTCRGNFALLWICRIKWTRAEVRCQTRNARGGYQIGVNAPTDQVLNRRVVARPLRLNIGLRDRCACPDEFLLKTANDVIKSTARKHISGGIVKARVGKLAISSCAGDIGQAEACQKQDECKNDYKCGALHLFVY